MATNLAELYKETAERCGDKPAFATRGKSKEFEAVNYKDLYEMGLNLATGLIDLGVKARDHVGLLADNRLEWIVADYGVLIAGAADVPRGTDVTDQDIEYILNHSDAQVVFVEHQAMLEKIQKNQSKLPNVKHIIMMDKDTRVTGNVLHLYDLMEKGKELRAGGDKRAEERMAGIKPDDLFTLIYTSGTTGAPKGVQLMHSNMLFQINNLPIQIVPEDRILSILPVWHIFERVFEMIAISFGACTYYTNVRNLGDDMKSVKPTFMASAPRLWESVYLKIYTGLEKKPAVARALFKAAYFCSRHFKAALRFLRGNDLDVNGRNPVVSVAMGLWKLIIAILLLIPNFLLDVIVLKKIRDATGGQLKGSVSGGGALPIHVDEFFNNIGIPVLEGYGMTETAPVLAVRTFDKLVIGSVGPVFPKTQLRLIDLTKNEVIYETGGKTQIRGRKGEIHVKGPQVMKGYFKNPEATAKVLKDGWMNTGDLGMITFNNTLKIMGRSKETVVLLGGENVEPVPIENKILESPLIDQVMVVGQDKKFLGALVVPALEPFAQYGSTLQELANKPEVQKKLQEEIKASVNDSTGFKVFERVVDCRVLPKPFEVGDELTNLFKLKRHVIAEKYADLIESMYK
ncbi:MAG: long-chain fatty acid--CoA ligase [Spirochaetales bacterium]|nr:long-chain fatty acid--CoA ligase [Spirochaetales bacterium]